MTHSRPARAYSVQPLLMSIPQPALCRSKLASEQNCGRSNCWIANRSGPSLRECNLDKLLTSVKSLVNSRISRNIECRLMMVLCCLQQLASEAGNVAVKFQCSLAGFRETDARCGQSRGVA